MKRPKLDGFTEIIDAWLDRPHRQRHAAKRVLDRLRDEHGFTGGYTIVKAYLPSISGAAGRCSCHCTTLRGTPRRTSARRWW